MAQQERQRSGGWDKDKDKELFAGKVMNADKTEGYTIRLMSYDGGDPKVELTRSYKQRDGEWYRELPKEGRIRSRRLPWYLVVELARLHEPMQAAKARMDRTGRAPEEDAKDQGDDIPF